MREGAPSQLSSSAGVAGSPAAHGGRAARHVDVGDRDDGRANGGAYLDRSAETSQAAPAPRPRASPSAERMHVDPVPGSPGRIDPLKAYARHVQRCAKQCSNERASEWKVYSEPPAE